MYARNDGVNNPPPAASIGGWTGSRAADGTQALRTGLNLARASQLTMLRLQLALHKSNRRTAMQALDHLLDIDAEMEGLAATLAGSPAYLTNDAALSGFIGRQKAAIAAEKHALTGGDWRNDTGSIAIAAHGDWAVDADTLAQNDEAESDEQTGSRRWRHALAVAIAIIVIAIGLMAYLSPTLPVALTSFADFR